LNAPELTLGAYFHQCAVEMTCLQLARSGRFLMSAPGMPRFVAPSRVRRINAMMMMCGNYDASGEFAYRVGLPGKSGVGGGILVIAPRHASIAVWSPGLNRQGNSLRGSEAMARLAKRTGWSVFG
jgi:glutaminase